VNTAGRRVASIFGTRITVVAFVLAFAKGFSEAASSVRKSLIVDNIFAVLSGGQGRHHFLEAQVRLGSDDTGQHAYVENKSVDTHDDLLDLFLNLNFCKGMRRTC
jgi:hypothetical protein